MTVKLNGIDCCCLFDLPKISDHRGCLGFLEEGEKFPFTIKRVFYLYNIPFGSRRGGHAHKNLHQFLICLNGSYCIELFDGTHTKKIRLAEPHVGLYVPPGIWVDLESVGKDSICIVLASDIYLELDYIRNMDTYIQYLQSISNVSQRNEN